MDALLQQYLEKLIKEHKKLDSRGVMQVTRFIELDLTDVFIPLLLRRDKEIGLARSGLGLREASVPSGLYRQAQISFDFDAGLANNDLKLADLFKRNRHWAILGDPGSGKTTLLKHHVLETARAYLDGTSDRLPVYITLRYFAEVWLNKNPSWLPENALLAYLIEDGLRELGFGDVNERQQLAAQIRDAAERGKLLLLLDGMDEERDRESKRQTGLAAAGLLRQHSENRCLLSSRIIGFDAAALTGHFKTATLQSFSSKQRNAYLRKWMLAVEKAEDIVADLATENRAKRKADELINRLDAVSGLAALAANPLLCTIIGLIYHQGGALPHQRVELYKLCVDTFIFNWEMTKRRQGLGAEAGLNPEETQAVLEPIALYFQQNCPGNRASRQQILHIMTDFLSKETGLGAAQAERKASEQLDLIRDVAGLFIDRGEEEYGFFHLTFQEYLAARAITRKRREIERHVYAHAFDPRWREVLKLAAAHQGLKSAEDGSEFIETILSVPHPHNQQMEYSFRLAFACMREARVEAETQQKMVARWIELYLGQPRLRGLLSGLVSRLGRGLQVSQETFSPLYQALTDADIELRRVAVSALGCFAPLPEIFEALRNALDDEVEEIRGLAISALGKFAVSPQTLNIWLKAFSGTDSRMRHMAAWELGQFAPASKALEALLIAVVDPVGEIRRAALFALGNFAPAPEALDALLEAATDMDEWNRMAVCWALAKFAPVPEALKAMFKIIAADEEKLWDVVDILDETSLTLVELLEFLADKDAQVRQGAVLALGYFAPDREALDALLRASADEYSEVRQCAVLALGHFAPAPEALDALLRAAADEYSGVRQRAVSALGNFAHDNEVLDALLKAFADADSEVRWEAVSALGNFASATEALEALLKASADVDSEVRQEAVSALGNFAPASEALDALLIACAEEDFEIRLRVVSALGNFGPATEALEALLKASNDEDSKVRRQATLALGNFAPAPQALDALLSMAADFEMSYPILSALEKFETSPISLEKLLEVLTHKDQVIRTWAVNAIGKLPRTDEITNILLKTLTDPQASIGATEALERIEMGAPI